MTRPKPTLLISTALLGLLALTGCAAAPGVVTSTEAAPTETPGADAPTDPAACLIRDWVITEDQVQVFYDAVSAGMGGITFDVTGGTGLRFGETDYEYTPDFVLEMEIAGMPASGTLTGSIKGDYTAADGIIVTEHDVSDVTLAVEVNGRPMDGTEQFEELLSAHPIVDSPYECGGDELVIQFSTGTGRVPIKLTPAS